VSGLFGIDLNMGPATKPKETYNLQGTTRALLGTELNSRILSRVWKVRYRADLEKRGKYEVYQRAANFTDCRAGDSNTLTLRREAS